MQIQNIQMRLIYLNQNSSYSDSDSNSFSTAYFWGFFNFTSDTETLPDQMMTLTVVTRPQFIQWEPMPINTFWRTISYYLTPFPIEMR